MATPDPDNIYRPIQEENEEERSKEIKRLIPKLRALKSHFTAAYNVLTNLITATRGEDNSSFDRSSGTMSALDRAREKLELRFQKVERCFNRMLALTHDNESAEKLDTDFKPVEDRNAAAIQAIGQLMIDLSPPQAQLQANGGGGFQNLKPVQALKPSFNLSFENSPTEMASWLAQFKSYYDISGLKDLPLDQQHAFLRAGIEADVWIAIQQQIQPTTRIFKNETELDDDSCEKFLSDAFQVRYPLIVRRHRYFTYERKGNQTFTNFYGNLLELASAAQLENMGQREYLIFRIIAGINDPAAVDKILSIPQADFNLEEVHRVAVAFEASKNYTGLTNKADHVACSVSSKRFSASQYGSKQGANNDKSPSNIQDEHDTHTENTAKGQGSQSLSGRAKIDALLRDKKCVRCGRDMHAKGTQCPFRNAQCHRCKNIGHISSTCSKE